ncbi:hypothetical protein [Cellulomonas sp. Marseille-Q8402]
MAGGVPEAEPDPVRVAQDAPDPASRFPPGEFVRTTPTGQVYEVRPGAEIDAPGMRPVAMTERRAYPELHATLPEDGDGGARGDGAGDGTGGAGGPSDDPPF